MGSAFVAAEELSVLSEGLRGMAVALQLKGHCVIRGSLSLWPTIIPGQFRMGIPKSHSDYHVLST